MNTTWRLDPEWRCRHGWLRGEQCPACKEIEELTTRSVEQAKTIRDLTTAVARVHAARGRYHSQIAMCDLYDLVGLKAERPMK